MQDLTPSPTHKFEHAINSGCLRAIEHIAATGVPTEILREVAAEHCADEWKANMAVRDAGETLREGLAELPAWLHSHCTPRGRHMLAQAERERALDAPLSNSARVAVAALKAHSDIPELAVAALRAVADTAEANPRLIPGDGVCGFIARRRRAADLIEAEEPLQVGHQGWRWMKVDDAGAQAAPAEWWDQE